MSVYFAKFPNSAIKIGHSSDVPYRLAQLKQYYGVPLTLLHVEAGTKADERQWHARFAGARLGKAEQFKPVPELLRSIGVEPFPGIDPDSVEFVEPVGGRRTGFKVRPSLLRGLAMLSAVEGKTESELLNEAIEEYLELRASLSA